MCGINFVGADVPGFYGNPETEDKEWDHSLVVSWYKVGVLMPFFRAHSHCETKRREPWCFDSSLP